MQTKLSATKEGTYWFNRLMKECKQISPYIRFKRIKYGFYRIYFRQAYLHEVCKDLGPNGYDFEMQDPRFRSQKYFEEYEDQAELTMNIKNFREGYYDSIQRIRTRVYMMKNSAEFYKEARNAYKQMRII